MGAAFFPGVKRLGRSDDHPHSSSAEVKERVEMYLYFPYMPLWLGQKQLYRFIPKILCLSICSCHFLLASIYIKLRSNKLVIILGLYEPEDERVRAF
jgi:hypothetical protein